MRKILFQTEQKTRVVNFYEVDENVPVFAKKNDKLIGMVVEDDKGWIVRLGRNSGATGYHKTLKECLKSCVKYDYEFFIN